MDLIKLVTKYFLNKAKAGERFTFLDRNVALALMDDDTAPEWFGVIAGISAEVVLEPGFLT